MRAYSIIFSAALLGCAATLSAATNSNGSSCRPMKSFEQGHELRQSQMMSAYNAPARIDVRGSWDLYLDLSYLFWQPIEENLELGISNASATVALPLTGNVVDIDFKYKNAFKAGLGIFSDTDNWDVFFEYTWFTGTQMTYSNGPAHGGIIPFWGHPANIPSSATTDILSGKGRWRLSMDILDATIGRSCYVGTQLVFRPFFGARGSFINQQYKAIYNTAPIGSFGTTPYQTKQKTKSWALGPEAGLDTSWMLGYGIRLIGNMEADLLFTRYNLRYEEEDSALPSSSLVVDLRQHHICYLRPHMDLEMGLGWGTYFSNHNYHIDLLATYGFQVFWNQNMFRRFVDATSVGASYVAGGDLYIQGLTTSLRFDF